MGGEKEERKGNMDERSRERTKEKEGNDECIKGDERKEGKKGERNELSPKGRMVRSAEENEGKKKGEKIMKETKEGLKERT